MTIAAVLVAYAAGLGILGSRMLGLARWTARASLLAIVTYLVAGWSVIVALGLAGLTLAVHATALGGGLSHLIGACVHRLQATYGTPGGGTVAGLGLTLAGAVATRTALTAMTHFRAAGRQALRHAQTARLVGRPEPTLGAVLVEHSQPAAYCVAGRQPTVILTTGAVQALDPGQLDAVLAHERAHLTGRHHRLVALARIGREVLPFLPLMRDAVKQVARLVELHADDAATRAAILGCSPPPWSSWPHPLVPHLPSPRVPPTRSRGFTGSWDPASHWVGYDGSCSAPPLRRSP